MILNRQYIIMRLQTLHWNFNDFANELGISFKATRRYILDDKALKPSLRLLDKMAAALRIPSNVASKYMIIDEPAYNPDCLPKKNRANFEKLYAGSTDGLNAAARLTAAEVLAKNPYGLIRKVGRPKGAVGKKKRDAAAKKRDSVAKTKVTKLKNAGSGDNITNAGSGDKLKNAGSGDNITNANPPAAARLPAAIYINADGKVAIE